jgi:hypothetical protein
MKSDLENVFPVRDPSWIVELDKELNTEEVNNLEVLADSREGKLGMDKVRTKKFFLQVGEGIIKQFPIWLDNMLIQIKAERGDNPKGKDVVFLRANKIEEHHHWQWWEDMAEFYQVAKSEFQNVKLEGAMAELSDYLTELSRYAALPVAMAAINYVIETDAAIMTKSVAEPLREKINDESALRWVEAHAKGDVEHSATSRKLIIEGVAKNPELQAEVE